MGGGDGQAGEGGDDDPAECADEDGDEEGGGEGCAPGKQAGGEAFEQSAGEPEGNGSAGGGGNGGVDEGLEGAGGTVADEGGDAFGIVVDAVGVGEGGDEENEKDGQSGPQSPWIEAIL